MVADAASSVWCSIAAHEYSSLWSHDSESHETAQAHPLTVSNPRTSRLATTTATLASLHRCQSNLTAHLLPISRTPTTIPALPTLASPPLTLRRPMHLRTATSASEAFAADRLASEKRTEYVG